MKPTDLPIVAGACDRVLNSHDTPLECVAIPWLHVIYAHPIFVRAYRRVALQLAGDGAAGRPTAASHFLAAQLAMRRWAGVARDVERSALRTATARRTEQKLPGVACSRLTQADVLIVSWLLEPDHLGRREDFYFGPLQDVLTGLGASSLLVLRNQSRRPAVQLLPSAFRPGPAGRVMLPDTGRLASELRLVRRCRAGRRMLHEKAAQSEDRRTRIVLREAARHAVSSPTMANLRLHDQIRRLCTYVRPRVVLTLYEGHAWERCVWHAARQVDPTVLCAGYQHSTVWDHTHALKRSLLPENGAYNPDFILTLGDDTRERLQADPRLAGTRFLTLGTHRRPEIGTPSNPGAYLDGPRRLPVVVVLPDGTLSETELLFAFACECAKKLPSTRFVLRLHPVLSFARIARRVACVGQLPANVEFSQEQHIATDFDRAGYCLYRGSSTVFHAILAGVKPFYVRLPDETSIDPLEGLSGWRQHVNSPDEFVRGWIEDQGRPEASVRQSWEQARAYCDRYAVPLRKQAVAELLEAAGLVSARRAAGVGA